MLSASKETVKNILGQIPFTAEVYWLLRQRGKPIQSRFSLKNLNENLPEIVSQATEIRKTAKTGKKILIFATLHYWIEHAALMGVALAAQGHKVTLGYLPYGDWRKQINLFDLRRQNAYARKVLGIASPLMDAVPFMSSHPAYKPLPEQLQSIAEQVSLYDTQYTLQNEDVSLDSEIYQLRLERNKAMARYAYQWLRINRPDSVIVPNGTIQEFGVLYRVSRLLDIPTITYEFGDQRKRIWLAQNSEVMRQDTTSLWNARKGIPLTEDQNKRLRQWFSARQRADLWENFARRWQDHPARGGEHARMALGLDQRPVVLLATNVLGDSLTLGRQIFSESMSEWIARTVQYFAGRPDVQLVIRIHPGEVLTHGISMETVVHNVLPTLPEYIHLISPQEQVNTYDLVDVADVGLVYTTTVGLEMALQGLPVIVAGQTHYRGRGFTLDPDSWVRFYKTIGSVLEKPSAFRLTGDQIELAWRYAYRFFFEFPLPFPWHLVRLWEDYRQNPINEVFSPHTFKTFEPTFRYLAGEPMEWKAIED
ncbi:MAG: hypothetical protein LLG42_13300 [Chloroflexi bacterium]|nr:hypothetical protein [Chloroflexota bacterium]